ncbi:ABC-type sugar transport system, periplasmic component [Halobacteroides halobius DSM 5150]|uniref:ABC-type sugar transport system, periplasmic component n=1 Tax=Halobacteroides halobius (strain ATCC 35273 / DSM 5150 / MD-1) TaxID=748449 RepID=L0K9J5_HALHC|nr:ABC transporter substrate-binding protein [Halobacteroides halobius]AGB41686.1 ABC-type sugar transport system, periplasmic component [Halobacteroides halobius DSM 5150]
MFNKKKISLSLVLVLVVGFLFSTNAFVDAWWIFGDDEEKNQEKVLEMWTREVSAQVIKPAIKEFNTKNKNIEIQLTSIPQSNFADKFATALASGSAPDIVSIDLVLVPYFSSVNAFKDITEKYNSLKFKNQLVNNMVRLGKYKGRQYALPFSSDVSALLYNKDHFREVGLDPEKPPKTWEELREYAKKLTTKEHYGYGFSGANGGAQMFTFMPYVWGNGGQILNNSKTKSIFNSPETREAFNLYKNLLENKVVPPGSVSYGWVQAQGAFTSGKVSMYPSGNFMVSLLNKKYPNLDFGVALLPKSEDGSHSSFAGGELIAIPKNSDYPKAAWKFIKYALSKKVQVNYFAKNGTIPVRKDFFDNKYFEANPVYKVFTKALTVANTPKTIRYRQLINPLVTTVQMILNGKTTTKEALSKFDTRVNQILKN